ncbi:MAG: hypothetical protein HC895_23215 [Leptolyngbyaceae cyanobacterium SM1_3_5]|nr:hypothetical protein [Leptolyngbyaceae cyanobacterium SM1_3_5]
MIHQESAIAPLRLSVHRSPHANVDLLHHSPEAVVQAVYRQILGRDVLSDQRLPAAEVKVKSGEITVRDFVRSVAKTPLFRSLHWDNLYVTKAIESIHRRLMGRPTMDAKR